MKLERICTKCQRPFWSWGSNRKQCLQCDPMPVRQAKALVECIKSGTVRL